MRVFQTNTRDYILESVAGSVELSVVVPVTLRQAQGERQKANRHKIPGHPSTSLGRTAEGEPAQDPRSPFDKLRANRATGTRSPVTLRQAQGERQKANRHKIPGHPSERQKANRHKIPGHPSTRSGRTAEGEPAQDPRSPFDKLRANGRRRTGTRSPVTEFRANGRRRTGTRSPVTLRQAQGERKKD